jgi:hypothetical protein
MPAVLDDVPPGVTISETRGNDGSSPEREIDLASVGMAGERQGHAVVDLGEDVGIVREGDRRGALGETVENRVHVPLRLPQVAESDEPEIEAFSLEAKALVLEDPDSGELEGRPDPRAVVPVVVITEHGEDAQGRLDLREDGSDRLRWNGLSPGHPGDDVVPREEHQVGPGAVDLGDDALELFEAVSRRADVEIAEQGHEEAVLLRGPPGDRELVPVRLERGRFQNERPEPERERHPEDHRERRLSSHRNSIAGNCGEVESMERSFCVSRGFRLILIPPGISDGTRAFSEG